MNDRELLELLEARSPALAPCPNCTRTDAMIVIHCADCGIASFPLRPRAVAQLKLRLMPIIRDAVSHGIALGELFDIS